MTAASVRKCPGTAVNLAMRSRFSPEIASTMPEESRVTARLEEKENFLPPLGANA